MKIVTLFMKHDYGEKARGKSLERLYFLPALKKIAKVFPLWLEDHEPETRQEQIIKFVEENKPDYVFTILMRDEISLHTLEYFKVKGIRVINWFCDSQWRNSWSTAVAKYLYCSIDVDKYSLDNYKELNLPVVKSQWGVHNPAKRLRSNYEYDVTFVGQRNPVRDWFISELSKDFKVKCFGYGWPGGKIRHPKNIIQKSRINLNLSNSIQTDIRFCEFINGKPDGHKFNEQIKARHFEIPAWGGFQLSHYALEVEDYFHIGKEIAVYGNVDDMKKQIDYYLSNPVSRETIKRAGWKRARGMTYNKRLKQAFREVKKWR